MSNHTGGKMITLNDDSFLFTIGDAQQYMDAQNDDLFEAFTNKLFRQSYKISKRNERYLGGIYNKKDKVVR